MKLYIQRKTKYPKIYSVPVKQFMRHVLLGEGATAGSITLVLTDDADMRDLNSTYRGLDQPTDVLAFPFHEDDEDGLYLGDIVISLERAVRQAPRYKNNAEQELARLIAHGILHLLGYDHHSPADGRRMKNAERRALVHYPEGTLMAQPDE